MGLNSQPGPRNEGTQEGHKRDTRKVLEGHKRDTIRTQKGHKTGTTRTYSNVCEAHWTNWCLSYGPKCNATFVDSWCKPGHGASMGPYLFNMVLQGVDFELGAGNVGAVAVDMGRPYL